jgi:hypothetical protein
MSDQVRASHLLIKHRGSRRPGKIALATNFTEDRLFAIYGHKVSLLKIPRVASRLSDNITRSKEEAIAILSGKT